jgi:hypothetical protein
LRRRASDEDGTDTPDAQNLVGVVIYGSAGAWIPFGGGCSNIVLGKAKGILGCSMTWVGGFDIRPGCVRRLQRHRSRPIREVLQMTVADVVLRVVMVLVMLFLAFAYYRVSIDPQESAMTRLLHRLLAKRYVRGLQTDAATQARILADLELCAARLAAEQQQLVGRNLEDAASWTHVSSESRPMPRS